MRQVPRMKRLIARAGWVEAEHRLCSHFGARCKRRWTAGNVEEVKLLHHPDGYHLHDETEWKPWYSDSEDRWKYPTKEEAEYTASLPFSYATLVTMAAVRRGRAKMRVPRLPRADPPGSRCGCSSCDPRTLREWMMPVQARAIGRAPLKEQPKPWFKKSYLAGTVGVRWRAKDCRAEDVKSCLALRKGSS